MQRLVVLACALPVIVGLAGCSTKKSSNPLSPSVAGPIPGVEISTPHLVAPNNVRVPVDQQPVILEFDNASTNGPRPLSYTIEVATDVNFKTKVFERTGVPPGSGRTALRLPDALATDRSYFWRARAEDGANTGPYPEEPASFDVYTPIVIEAPTPQAPINNVVVDSLRPTFIIGNAPRSGPVGPISYVIDVSLDYGFTQTYTIGPVPEQGGQTRIQSPVDAPYATYFYWRVRAQDNRTIGPWSPPTAFSTPAKPAPAPPPGGGGGGGGGNQGCHVGAGPATEDRARQIVLGCAGEFPNLLGVFPTDNQAIAADEEFLLRVIWHLQLQGFQSGRQRNPSGLISNDKLTIFINGAWHAYDIMSMGYAGHATTVTFNEVTPPNYVPSSGRADGT